MVQALIAVKAAKFADLLRDTSALWAAQALPGRFFSITEVTLNPEFTRATFWVDVLIPEQKEETLRLLRKKRSDLEKYLFKTITRRALPYITFADDKRAESNQRLDNLLHS